MVDTWDLIKQLNAGTGDDSEERRLLSEIESLRYRAIESGVAPELTQPRESLFSKMLDVLDTPKQFVQGALKGLFTGLSSDPIQNASLGAYEGMRDDINLFDALRDEGVGLQDYPVLRGALGFAGELATDPLSYLGIGAISRAGKVARAGSQPLNDIGKAFVQAKRSELLDSGIDILDADTLIDQSFQAIGSYNKLRKELAAAEKVHDTAKARDIRLKLNEEAALASRIGIEPDEALGLLEPTKIYADISIPFLGNLTKAGRAKNAKTVDELKQLEEALMQGAGDTGGKGIRTQANILRARLGRTFNPIDIKLGEYEVPEQFVQGYYNLKEQAARGIESVLDDFRADLDAAAVVYPVLGKPIKLAQGTAKKAAEVAGFMASTMKNIFARKMALGRGYYNVRDYETAKATADASALDFVLEFDPTFASMTKAAKEGGSYKATAGITPKGQIAKSPFEEAETVRKQATLAIDGALKGLLTKLEGTESGKFILEQISKRRAGLDTDPNYLAGLDAAMPIFRGLLDAEIKNAGFGQDVATYALRLMGKFDELSQAESKLGIQSGFLSTYVPHRYKLIDEAGGVGKSAVQFTQQRKFDTIQQALETMGQVAETDAASLLYTRARESFIKRAQTQLFQRMVTLNALPESVVGILAREALQEGPDSDAFKILTARGYQPRAISTMPGYELFTNPPEQVMLKPGGPGEYLAERTETSKKMIDVLSEFDKKSDLVALAHGIAPSGFKDAAPLFHEFSKKITVDGKEYVVPDILAKAHAEIVSNKDVLKRMVSGHPRGDKILDAYDRATVAFKHGMTVLFPAYWNINLVGDRILGALQDVSNLAPGLSARAYSVLNGAGGVKLGNTGRVLSPPEYKKIAKQMGMSIDAREILEFQDTWARLHPESFFNEQRGVLGNLGAGAPQAAFRAYQQKMSNLFENFYRHQVFINHLEKGSTIQDAMRLTNEGLIDYRNLSPVESSLFRRFFMFYGWLQGSTKKTLTSMLFSPGDIQKQIKGARGLSEFFSGQGAIPTPEGEEMKQLEALVSQEQISFPLGKTKDGKTLIGRAGFLPANTILQQFSLFAPRNLSPGELADTFHDSASRTLQKQFASANPMIKAIAEKVANKNLYFDKPLSAKFLRTVPSLAAKAESVVGYPYNQIPAKAVDEVMKRFLRAKDDGQGNLIADPGRMWLLANFIPGLARALSTYKNALDEKVDPGARAFRLLSGLRYDKQDAERMMLYEQRENLRNLIEEQSIPKMNQ